MYGQVGRRRRICTDIKKEEEEEYVWECRKKKKDTFGYIGRKRKL